jgi:hypothetical protein
MRGATMSRTSVRRVSLRMADNIFAVQAGRRDSHYVGPGRERQRAVLTASWAGPR